METKEITIELIRHLFAYSNALTLTLGQLLRDVEELERIEPWKPYTDEQRRNWCSPWKK